MLSSYGPLFAELLSSARCCEHGAGHANESKRPQLAALTVANAFAGQKVFDQQAARCCLAGIWLLHDFLDESHSISQEIETAEGSYWHAIMHRREPDYFNSKYWNRRVGQHAIFPLVAKSAKELVKAAGAQDAVAKQLDRSREWNPDRFVDWCEQLANGQASQRELAERVAQAEWKLLFDHCWRQAIGA